MFISKNKPTQLYMDKMRRVEPQGVYQYFLGPCMQQETFFAQPACQVNTLLQSNITTEPQGT